jgi:hypothetical protein
MQYKIIAWQLKLILIMRLLSTIEVVQKFHFIRMNKLSKTLTKQYKLIQILSMLIIIEE